MAAGLVLPLLPWAARNWERFHEVQFLAPRFAASPDEYTPRGLYAWTGTWLVRYRDVYLVPWKAGSERIDITDIPEAAFDTPEERARVAALLDRYNETQRMTAEVDEGFAELARERTLRHPLRTYLRVPLARMATIWFTPRVELLPISGRLWPVRERWLSDPVDFSVTLLFGALNIFYVGLAAAGLFRVNAEVKRETQRSATIWTPRAAVELLVAFIAVRTVFLSTVETPEPRYVLECFPALLALGAMAWLPSRGARLRSAIPPRFRLVRLRMNRDMSDLRKPFFHAVFELGGDVVNRGNRQAALHDAVAGEDHLVFDFTDAHFVAASQRREIIS